MADTITVEASLRIRRPAAEVRAQYRDIDHHMRHNVHPGICFQWLPSAPGERKIRTTFRILGVAQFDVALLEDVPDGSLIIRHIEGTNAGMIVLHQFVEVDPQTTEVRLRADAPSTLARALLGPLFTIGARQVLKKALHEDKLDLEKAQYTPNRAAGDLDSPLSSLHPWLEQCALHARTDAARSVLNAACFMAAVDGAVETSERDALQRIALRLHLGAADVARAMLELDSVVASSNSSDYGLHLGEQLARHGATQAGLTAAAVVAMVSQGMTLSELELLRRLAKPSNLAEHELAGLVESIDEALDVVCR